MSKSWILLGMMGAGKSSVGRVLAQLTGRDFFDTDVLLQKRLGRTIPQIFQIYGEAAFRDHETSVLRNLSPGEHVLATGGGIVLREDNWDELRRLGTTIYLSATHQTLVDRLAASKKRRPLLEVDEWATRLDELMEQRRYLYERADVTIPVDGIEVEEAAARIRDAVEAK